jgi:glycosyltransferase involved in cell wall biosynthesis
MNVSVIIPSNGNRESVFKSIKSVRDQVFNFKVEIIVVINGDLFEKLIIKKLNELSIKYFLVLN